MDSQEAGKYDDLTHAAAHSVSLLSSPAQSLTLLPLDSKSFAVVLKSFWTHRDAASAAEKEGSWQSTLKKIASGNQL